VQLTYVTDVVKPSWSPDGSRIAFLSLSERSEPRGLFWIPADGSLHRPIPILPDVGSFAWRP
jgi:Tol biopolymer transport system component